MATKAKKFIGRNKYHFEKMKVNATKRITIPPKDPIAGLRALTAAYAFARRHNEQARKKSEHIRFAGETRGSAMVIQRVQ